MPPDESKTILLSAVRAFGIARSRLLLIEKLVSCGWQVVVAASLDDVYAPLLAEAGAILEHVSFGRGGLSLLSDLQAVIKMSSIFRTYQPKLVHLFNTRPIILGSWSACLYPQTKLVCTVTGLGHTFVNSGPIRTLSVFGYQNALKRSDIVIFQNPDDRQLFINQNWISREKARLVVGSGVDTTSFVPRDQATSLSKEPLKILMVARLLWQKGIREFIRAAEIIKEKRPDTHCLLAGEWDPTHPDSVEKDWMQEKIEQGVIEFLGFIDDMPKVLQNVDIFVLPSSYREGVPRVLMEAASCGIPVITTDAPGCRETVEDGKTGLLVPPGDAHVLASAILNLLDNPSLRRQMGRVGRDLAKQQFDVRKVTQEYIEMYYEIGLDRE